MGGLGLFKKQQIVGDAEGLWDMLNKAEMKFSGAQETCCCQHCLAAFFFLSGSSICLCVSSDVRNAGVETELRSKRLCQMHLQLFYIYVFI